jgi:hypothetical protein
LIGKQVSWGIASIYIVCGGRDIVGIVTDPLVRPSRSTGRWITAESTKLVEALINTSEDTDTSEEPR